MIWLVPALLAGCTLEEVVRDTDVDPPLSIRGIREASATGAVQVAAVVTSRRTTTGTAFFVQDPGGGPGSGMRVAIGGVLPGWPPLPGRLVRLTGLVSHTSQGPVLSLKRSADAVDRGVFVPTVATPWADGPLPYDLVALAGLTVTSPPDPTGRADTDGPLPLGGAFGITPGWGAEGDAIGILLDDRLSLRRPADWTGDLDGLDPIALDVADIRSGAWPDGTPVVLADALQIAPWSRGGRYTVVQDEAGLGLWIDAGGYPVPGAVGEVATWTGVIRSDGEGPRLEVWDPPLVTGSRPPLPGPPGEDGSPATLVAHDLDGPDLYGDWHAQDTEGPVLLDDRFLPLVDLPDPVHVFGVIRQTPTERRLAVLAWESD